LELEQLFLVLQQLIFLTNDHVGSNNGELIKVFADEHSLSTNYVGYCPAPRESDLQPGSDYEVTFGGWTVGTAGSATVTDSATVDIFAMELPSSLLSSLKLKSDDLKDLLKDPAVLKMLRNAAGPGFAKRPPRLELDSKLEKKAERKKRVERLTEEKLAPTVLAGERVLVSKIDDWDEIPTPQSQKGLASAVRNFNRTRSVLIDDQKKIISRPVSLKG